MYWESMVELRRLLLSLLVFVNNQVLQIVCSLFLCFSFLLQHIISFPFKNNRSNYIESISLALLCMSAVLNLGKASIISQSLSVDSYSFVAVNVFISLEQSMPLFLILVIIVAEIGAKAFKYEMN